MTATNATIALEGATEVSLAFALAAPRIEVSRSTRNILSVPIAKAADPADGGEALLERYESAICTPAAVIRTPGIILREGAIFGCGRDDKNYERE
jgi:hypothetical protein